MAEIDAVQHQEQAAENRADKRSYSRVSSFFPAFYRILSSPDEPQLCPRSRGSIEANLSSQLAAAGNIPTALINFLVSLNTKVDSILALMQKESLIEYFPNQLMVAEISASGVLVSSDALKVGNYIELVMYLGEYPPRVASGIGHVLRQLAGDSGKSPLFAVHFVNIRESDREDIVRYVFQEERQRIRTQKLK